MTLGEMVMDGLKRLVVAGVLVFLVFFALAAIVVLVFGVGWLLTVLEGAGR